MNRLDLGMTLPEAIAAPRASQRNAAGTDVEQAFLDQTDLVAKLKARGQVFNRRPRSAPPPGSSSSATARCSPPPSRCGAAAAARWWSARAAEATGGANRYWACGTLTVSVRSTTG